MNARLLASLAATASFVLGSGAAAAQTAAGTEERITRNAAGPAGEHAADELRDPTQFEFLRREPGEITVKPRVAAGGGRELGRAVLGVVVRHDDLAGDAVLLQHAERGGLLEHACPARGVELVGAWFER